MLLNLEDLQLKIGDDSFILRRFERTDWKQIASVNLEQLKASSADWKVIEDNIGNVLYCHVESEFERKSLDANLVKMFQLSQVVVSYLLHIRQLAFAELSSLKQQLTANKKTLESAVKDRDESVRKWKELKKSVKNQQQQKSAPADYYKCPWCSKAFLNRDYLASHLQRRHTHNMSSSTGQSLTSSTAAAAAATTGSELLLLDELKTRLQIAEKQLTEEKLLLHTIINKMDESNVSLQGVVVNEVQKMRETLLKVGEGELKAESLQVPTKTNSIASDVQVNSGEVDKEESPKVEQVTEVVWATTATPIEPNDDPTAVPPLVQPQQLPQWSSPQEEETVNAVEASPHINKMEQEIAAKSRSSSCSEDEDRKREVSTPTSIDRRVLMERFKKTMEAALEQRMQRLIASTVKGNSSSSSKKEQNKKKLTVEEAQRAIANISSTTTNASSVFNSTEYRRMRRRVEAQMNQRLGNSNKTDAHKVKSSCSRKKNCNAAKKEEKETTTKTSAAPNSNRRPLITIRSQVPPNTTTTVSTPPPAATSSPVQQQQQQRAPVPTPRLARGTPLTTTKTKSVDDGDNVSEESGGGVGSNPLISKHEEEEDLLLLLMARDGEAITMTSSSVGYEDSRTKRPAVVMTKPTSNEAAAVPPPCTDVSGAVDTLSSGKPNKPPSPPVRSPFTQLTTTTTTTTPAAVKDEDTDDSFSLSSLDAILSELKRPGNKFGVVLPPSIATAATLPSKTVQWRVPVVESEQQKPPLDESWDS